ncbi:hypothetical protein, partial [Pseudomonas sp. 51_B]|uniref:hypothetical protein n=1 Tax=Pseudomonas sp. 51_B TaxID=2813573 RepID=UPI001A9D9D88
AWREIASYEPGGRARLSQASLAENKRRSERSSRCAARAALDLRPNINLKAYTPKAQSLFRLILTTLSAHPVL